MAPELQWIILKMSRPLARGDLWRELAENWCERLIVVVSADNLRSEDIRVSRGLSWESTVDDLVAEIKSNPTISELKSCRHLVVTLEAMPRSGSTGQVKISTAPAGLYSIPSAAKANGRIPTRTAAPSGSCRR